MSEKKPSHEVKLSNRVRRALVREVTKNLMVTLKQLRSSSVKLGEPSRRTTISAALYQSSFYGRLDTISMVKHGGSSIMLWGCFSAAGTGRLVGIEEKINRAKDRDPL